jgi:hypothetical protein
MYEVFECLRCGHIFDMTDEARKEFVKNGGCVIKCPECRCCSLERIEPRTDIPNVSLCDTEEDVEKVNDLIDNLW